MKLYILARLAQDSKYTLRSLRKNFGFTIIAILVLALGIGSNLAVFSLVDSLFLKSLPVEKPGELAQIATVDREGRLGAMPSTLVDSLRGEPVFRGVCGYFTSRMPLDLNGTIRSTSALAMTGDCFATLGLRARIGRPFTLDDDRRGGAGVALLTDSFWRSSFGASADAVGRKVLVKGAAFTIIGVADPRFTGFRLGSVPDAIIPLSQTPLDFVPLPNRPVFFLVYAIARRAAGVSERQAQARMSVLQKQLLEESAPVRYNEAERREYLARKIVLSPADPGSNSHLRDRFGKPLYTILGICACVLLIACVNLTSLLLARGLGRAKEIAVRLALGANRAAVVRLFILQSSALVLAGGVFGALFAQWTRRWLVVEAGDLFSVAPDLAVDSHTASFLAGLMLLAMVALAAAPAWQAARFHRSAALNESGRGVVGSSTRNQRVLLALQIAVTLALVSGSGLFTASMKHLDEMNPGMRTAGVSESMLAPLAGGYGGPPTGP